MLATVRRGCYTPDQLRTMLQAPTESVRPQTSCQLQYMLVHVDTSSGQQDHLVRRQLHPTPAAERQVAFTVSCNQSAGDRVLPISAGMRASARHHVTG